VTLEPGARLALLDVLVPGRLARGDLYQFERYAARLKAYNSAGRLLLAERGCAQIAQANYSSKRKIDLGTAVLPNSCGMLVRALGATASQVHAALLGIWGMLGG
jgi:urease accessory protein UreH